MDQWRFLKKKRGERKKEREEERESESGREEERISEGQVWQFTYFGAISTTLNNLVILPQNQWNLVLFPPISSLKILN